MTSLIHQLRYLAGAVVLAAGLLLGFAASGAVPLQAVADEPPALLPPSAPSHVAVFQVETAAPAQYDEVLSVVDFEPGAWTYEHSYNGMAFFSVAEGTLTLRDAGKDTSYGRGQSFRRDRGAPFAIGNETTARARLIVTVLASPGAAGEARESDAAKPSRLPVTAFTGKTTLTTVPTRFILNQAIFEFRAGAGSGAHTHPASQGLQIVMSGEQVHRLSTGDVVQRPGDVFHDLASRPVSHENRGREPMVDVVSYVFWDNPPAVPASLPGVAPLPIPGR